MTTVQNFESTYYHNWINGKNGISEDFNKNSCQVNHRLKEFMENNDVAVTMSISDVGKQKLFGKNAEDAMKEGIDLLYKNVDKSDVFSMQEGDKWKVFDDFLDFTNAYDSISVDKKTLQNVMGDIMTNGGALVGECVYTDNQGRQLDSTELSLLVESSTSALQAFSDSFLQGEVKQGFDELIEKYDSHMKKQLQGYQSIDEEFNHALASLNENSKQNLESFRVSHGISKDNKKLIAIKESLGNVEISDSEKKQYINSVNNLFKKINSQNLKSVLEEIKEQHIDFSSGHSKNLSVKDYIQNRNKWVFGQIEETWKKVTELCGK